MDRNTCVARVTVLPSIPPTVGFTSVPAQVARGAALDVAVEAADNRAVQRLEFTIGARTVTVATAEADGRTYRAQISTADLTVGPQTVLARAVDRVGNFATTSASVSIAQPPAAAPWTRTRTAPLKTGADCDDANPARQAGCGREVPGRTGVDDELRPAPTRSRSLSATVAEQLGVDSQVLRASRR